MRKHESSQQVVSGELEEKQTHCLELNVTLHGGTADRAAPHGGKQDGKLIMRN